MTFNEEKIAPLLMLLAVSTIITAVLSWFSQIAGDAAFFIALSLAAITTLSSLIFHWLIPVDDSKTVLRIFIMVNCIYLFILVPKLLNLNSG